MQIQCKFFKNKLFFKQKKLKSFEDYFLQVKENFLKKLTYFIGY